MGRPGLVGTMARTAVIAGTASATVGAVNHHQDAKAQAAADQQAGQQQAMQSQAEMDAMQQQLAAQQAAQQAQPAAPSTDDVMATLTKLGALHDSGVLSDEEFASAKAKVLSGLS